MAEAGDRQDDFLKPEVIVVGRTRSGAPVLDANALGFTLTISDETLAEIQRLEDEQLAATLAAPPLYFR